MNKHTVSEHYFTFIDALEALASIRDHAVDAQTRQRANDAGVALNALLELDAKKYKPEKGWGSGFAYVNADGTYSIVDDETGEFIGIASENFTPPENS